MSGRVLVRGLLWAAGWAGLGAGLAAQQEKTAARRPQLWAIVVGVDNYADPLIPDCRSAVRDSGSVLGWLLNEGGWGRDHVLFLTDLGSRSPGRVDAPRPNILPSRDNLEWAFREWLPSKKPQAGDLVVFYFAGRVGRDASTPAPGIPARHFLLPTDATLGNVAITGWSLERAIDRLVLETSGRCQVVCWLATSAAGVALPGARAPVPTAGVPAGGADDPAREWLSRLTHWPRVAAWLASDRPPASIDRNEPSSLFTRTMLDGLGKDGRRLGLEASLRGLQHDPTLKRQGFRAIGMIQPRLTLRADRFGEPAEVRPEVTLQLGHSDRITAIVGTADGQRIITASRDSTIRAWSLKDRALLRVLPGHEVGVNALGLSADGRWLVSGGSRPLNALLVHDLGRDFRRIVPDQPHEHRVDLVAMLPDGDHAVTVDLNARAFLWDLRESPPKPRPWPGKGDCLAVAPGGGKVFALSGDRTVRVFDATGTVEGPELHWAGQPSTLAVDPSGRRLAVGFDGGKVLLRDLETGVETPRGVPAGPISQLAISTQGHLAVGHPGGLSLYTGSGERTLLLRPNARPTFSPDGSYLSAYSGDEAGLQVWRVEGDTPRLILDDEQADVSALCFLGDGRTLATGGAMGSVKTWPLEGPDGEESWTFPPNRAKVRQVGTSPGRGHLLLINDLGQAGLWDIRERTCRRLPGAWSSGCFSPVDEELILTEAPGPGRPGRVVRVRVDGVRIDADPSFFRRRADGFEVPPEAAFAGVTASPDGTRVAATVGPSQVPMVCVWDRKTGRLTHRLTEAGLGGPTRSLAFSADARHLLTAGDSPEARLWDLSAVEGEPRAPVVTFRPRRGGGPARNISAIAIRPGDARQVVIGHRDGAVRLWGWREGVAEPDGPTDLAPNYFPGEVKALTFLVDGPDDYLAAGGDGTSMWLGRFSGARVERAGLGARPHHAEQINTLAGWPSGPPGGASPAILVSGSDDSAVKLWTLRGRTLGLSGTFSAAWGAADALDEPGDLDWVVHTPQGQFDASVRGRELIRFARGEKAHPMESFDGSGLDTVGLGERLLAANPGGPAIALDEPPPILVEAPPGLDPKRAEVDLTIHLGSSDLKDIRLFHNNAPVGAGLEATAGRAQGAGPSPSRITVPVRLVKGENRFHVMAAYAGRGKAFESRSPEVVLPFRGEEEAGRLHVLSFGVGDYRRNRLKYVDHDAKRLSEVLHERGLDVAGKKGRRFVRTDAEVTPEGVDADFRALAREARPQDTVVVFLAGHTGVFEDNRFCLLLSSYPFPEAGPAVARERDAVVARDGFGLKSAPEHVMPYAVIEANLMRIKALKRLVIVDACQAESILDDDQVKQIRKWMEIGSRRARTSYLMAARRGEPALEVEALRHGLFTYVLLRGMGGTALDREQEPAEVAGLDLPLDADFNHDQIISTAELERYAHLALPPISRLFPRLVTRSRDQAARSRPELPAVDEGMLQQRLRMQTALDSFDLVPLVK